MEPKERIIIALDFEDLKPTLTLVDALGEHAKFYKVGYQILLSSGFTVLDELVNRGKQIFCDLKLHDIPSTVAGAVRNLTARSVWAITIHATGGSAMLKTAVNSVDGFIHRPKLLAVTVLTSLDKTTLNDELLVTVPVVNYTVHLARLARFCNCDGVVASGNEVVNVKEACGEDFIVVVPGVRPSWSKRYDQRRITTPAEAIRSGADFLVIGRPITKAPNPTDAFLKISEEISHLI